MKKLLYISYLFPPVGGSGVQRSLKFAKHLPEYGWEPIMLVANHRFLKQPKDYSLLREISPELVIHSTFAIDIRWVFKLLWGLRLHKLVDMINRYCLIPDADILWLPFAKAAVKHIFSKNKIDMVFITAPPYSALFLGDYVKQLYGVDYCVDFRDLWTSGVGRADNPPTLRIRHKEKQWEKGILHQAKSVVCVNDAMVSKLLHIYPELAPEKLHGITNGYDANDFASITSYKRRESMHIVFTGSLYGRFQPDIIWQAVSELLTEGLINPDKLRFDIYGHNTVSFVMGKYASNSTVRRMVRIHGYLPHKASISKICTADALLVLSPAGISSDTDSHSKLYEYMRSERPIFAVVSPESIGTRILEGSGTSFIADSSSLASIKETLLTIYIKWTKDELALHPDREYVSRFDRRALTKKLAFILDAATVDKH